MAQVHADGLVDRRRPGIVLGHEALDHLQLLRRGQALVQLDPRPGGQLDDAVLGEVLHAAADVPAPLVHHGVRRGVHGHEGQLVEPTGDVALPVHVAHGLAGAHGDAQHVVVLQAHGPGQGGHVAVVAHGVGDVPEGVLHRPDVDVLHLGVERILGHLQKQGGHHGPVVDEHAGGADAHRVHPGHVLGGGLEGGHDAVVVVLGIGGHLRVPDHLLGEHGLPVHHGGHLPVGPAGVEANAAAVYMPADGLGHVPLLGDLVADDHFEGPLVHAGHEVGVKGPGSGEGVGLLQIGTDPLVAADIDLPAALHPQQALHQPVHVVAVGLIPLVGAVDEGMAHRHLSPVPLHGDGHRLSGRGQKGLVESHHGEKFPVQRRDVSQLHLDSKSVHVTSPRLLSKCHRHRAGRRDKPRSHCTTGFSFCHQKSTILWGILSALAAERREAF